MIAILGLLVLVVAVLVALTGGMPDPGQASTLPDGTVDPAAGERSGLLHRIGYRKGSQP